MIGLMFFAGIVIWLVIVSYLSNRIPDWLGVSRFKGSMRFALFVILLLLPISDELIGRWQFHRLCKREAVVWLSPDWKNVKRAKEINNPIVNLKWYLIRIREQSIEYIDSDTRKIFMKYKAFHTSGGILFDRFELGLGASTSCWPSDWVKTNKQVNIDQLLKQGASK